VPALSDLALAQDVSDHWSCAIYFFAFFLKKQRFLYPAWRTARSALNNIQNRAELSGKNQESIERKRPE
jgi:hypothetical protein